jgi:hypothetical protein
MEGLTFDLNTGNEITLADVFADNVDYLALLNNAVMKDLNEVSAQDEGYFTRWHGLKLAESFKGLSPDQKFFLDAYGINLIFDYDTPEFYLSDFMAQTIHIPYENLNRSVAIMKRFYDEREKIFTSEDEEVKSLIYSGYTNIPIQKQEYADGYIYVYNYTKVSPNFPESLMEKVMAMSSVPQAKIHEMNQYVMNERAHWNEEVNGYFEQHVNAGTVGHYAIVTKNINGATRDTGFFSNECKTYDLKSGREMALAEMFVDGFDYKSLVRKTFEKTIADRGGLYQEGRKMSEEEIRELLDEILSGNPGFCPYPNSIHIVAGDAEFAGGYREPLQISLDFKEIGYENLAVFDSR